MLLIARSYLLFIHVSSNFEFIFGLRVLSNALQASQSDFIILNQTMNDEF